MPEQKYIYVNDDTHYIILHWMVLISLLLQIKIIANCLLFHYLMLGILPSNITVLNWEESPSSLDEFQEPPPDKSQQGPPHSF